MERVTATLHGLVSDGVTHVVGIPDNTSAPLFHEIARHTTLRLVTATREGEAVSIASGLWLGRASPLLVIQNTGLLESGDAIRGTATRMGAAIPMVITGRGYAKMAAVGLEHDERGAGAPGAASDLTRADVDSVALLTEPTLRAWGVPFERCEGDADPVAAISRAIRSARARGRPTAVVMARPLR